ncbi:MAG TPA: hypothetical protein VEH84_07405 [Alphaproteobacteria bacterium]|nr:hypothetical protein [Alphaproteobacteria bacterium]
MARLVPVMLEEQVLGFAQSEQEACLLAAHLDLRPGQSLEIREHADQWLVVIRGRPQTLADIIQRHLDGRPVSPTVH